VIVAVESNFVLEMALRQDEVADCERLITLAREGSIRLAIPACSLFEPYETLVRRRKQREAISQKLRDELRELARTEAFAHLGETSMTVTRALAESSEIQAKALDNAVVNLSGVATVIPLTAEVMRNAVNVPLVFSLSPQDSVVFASTDLYLKEQGQGEKVFATKNSRDFLSDDVEDWFRRYNCKVLATFAATRQYVEHSLANPRAPPSAPNG
jgi:predicted nucleic acid-binding protein